MAPSSDVKDTEKDKDKDESNNSIARYFDEPSAENLESESDCNIVNATTELNYDDHITPSGYYSSSCFSWYIAPIILPLSILAINFLRLFVCTSQYCFFNGET